MVENVTQINGVITVDVRVKNIMYVEKIIFRILLNVVENKSIMDDSAITCDQIIESYSEETKTIPTNFDEKKPHVYKLL